MNDLLKLLVTKAYAAPYVIDGTSLGLQYTDISSLLVFVVKMIISLCGLAFFVMLLYGGFKFVTSQGDKMAVTEAQNAISHAVIGVAIAAGLFAIMTLLQNIFGFSLVNISI